MAVPVGSRCRLGNLPADARVQIELVWGTAYHGAPGFSVDLLLLALWCAWPETSPFTENVPVLGVRL